MTNCSKTSVKFPKCNEDEFFKELKKNIDGYFKVKNLSKLGNFELYFKSALFVVSFFFLYSLLYFVVSSPAVLATYVFLGVNLTLLMFNTCHDICHDTFSKSRVMNSGLMFLGEIFFANKHSWKLKHNEGHHTYTNIEGHDDDIDLHNLVRLSKTEKRHALHAFQHWYAPFLYCFLSLQWLFFSDMFYQMKVYQKKNLGYWPIVKTLMCKVLHIGLFLVLPLLYAPSFAWAIVLGFLCMHFVCGLTMSVIFQLAHVVDNVQFPTPNEKGEMKHSWAIHEMYTTSNFGRSFLVGYLLGGLSYQVEHHLFPHICHVHYRNISHIVQETAGKFRIPYNYYPTVFKAIKAHFSFLKKMGRSPKAS